MRPSRAGVAVVVCIGVLGAARADSKTWTGSGDWHADAGNWSGGTVPADGGSEFRRIAASAPS